MLIGWRTRFELHYKWLQICRDIPESKLNMLKEGFDVIQLVRSTKMYVYLINIFLHINQITQLYGYYKIISVCFESYGR